MLPHVLIDQFSYEQLAVLLEARKRRKRAEFRWEYQQLYILASGLGIKLPKPASDPLPAMSAEAIDAELAKAASQGVNVQYHKPD